MKGVLKLDRAPEGSARYWMLLCCMLAQVKGVLDLHAPPISRDQPATGCFYTNILVQVEAVLDQDATSPPPPPQGSARYWMLLCCILIQVKGVLELDRAPEGSVRYWMLLCCILIQVKGVLELDRAPEGSARYCALDKWTGQLNNLQKLVLNKMA